MKLAKLLILVSLALTLGPLVKADSTSNLTAQNPIPIAIVNATIGLTPIEDSNSGFGRFFLSWVFQGNFNGFVFWSGPSEGEPFTVSDNKITFIPGEYRHFIGGDPWPDEALDISASKICCADYFSMNLGEFTFTLPSTVTPTLGTPDEGDKYYLFNVPVLISDVPPLPEPDTLVLLSSGALALLAVLRWAGDGRRTVT